MSSQSTGRSTSSESGPPEHRNFIGGEWVGSGNGATLEVVNPATEHVIASIPAATADDVDAAVAAASAAESGWAALDWGRRADMLIELSRRLDEVQEELAVLDTTDSGNPLAGMRGDAARAGKEIRYFAGLGGEAKGVTLPATPEQMVLTNREPFGVVARLTAFNHPLQFAAGKTAAPLIAGNAVVLKPSEHTSLSTLRLAEIASEILPPGVLNVVTGTGGVTGDALVSHPDVPRIAFTGGVPTARAILAATAPYVKTVTAELGGKNPMIVFPDVDVAKAAKAAVAGMNLRRSTGQSCQSNSRVIVHRSIAAEFADRVAEEVSGLRIGDPLNPEIEVGPVCFEAHYERVMAYIESGKAEGARVLTGGRRPENAERGYFIEPTVFADVDPAMRIAREEIFGPVVSLFEWHDYEDMIALANGVEYGLTANIWTNDLKQAHRTARRIQAGMVWINGNGKKPQGVPFGGYKQSGLGKEGSLEELISYTREKAIIINLV